MGDGISIRLARSDQSSHGAVGRAPGGSEMPANAEDAPTEGERHLRKGRASSAGGGWHSQRGVSPETVRDPRRFIEIDSEGSPIGAGRGIPREQTRGSLPGNYERTRVPLECVQAIPAAQSGRAIESRSPARPRLRACQSQPECPFPDRALPQIRLALFAGRSGVPCAPERGENHRCHHRGRSVGVLAPARSSMSPSYGARIVNKG